MSVEIPQTVRLDKWLWAARFFKTRQLSIEAIAAGHIELNGDRAKPAKSVKPGDEIHVRKPPYEFIVNVLSVSEKRGSATIARELFAETAESIAAREKLHAELRDMPAPIFKGRPTKRDRRTLETWQRAASLMDDE
ncbi:MAG: RNA-binding S4 domain-containing protein [Betaproteobacteria bacterium]